MKVFLSSVVTGFEECRDAAAAAAEMLGHEVLRAEDFGARATSPREACLAGVRNADVVLVVLGARYGARQPSGRSATHEEFEEARGTKTVLAFVQREVAPEPDQSAFIQEVEAWATGLHVKHFGTPKELRAGVAQALQGLAVQHARGPMAPERGVERVRALLETRAQVRRQSVLLATAALPDQALLRPAQLEDAALPQALLGIAQQVGVRGLARSDNWAEGENEIRLATRDGEVEFVVTDRGATRVIVPFERDRRGSGNLLLAIVEEDLAAGLDQALSLASAVLDHVDPAGRATHVVVAAQVLGGEHYKIRARREIERSPNRGELAMSGSRGASLLDPAWRPRAELRERRAGLVQDFVAKFKRARR